MKAFTIAAAAAAATLTLTLSACGVGGDEASASSGDCPFEADESFTGTLRLGYQKIPNGDVVVKDQKVLENCLPEATVKWSNFASGGDVVQAFGGGSLDIGLAGSSPSTKALSAPLNLPVSVIWIHDVIGAAESLVVRNGVDATSIEDLRGKTIATPFGSTAHYSLLQAIADAGQDSADYTIVNSEPEQIAPAWGRGDIDAAWIWDPTLSELKKDGTVILTSEDTAKAGKPTFDLAIADNDFVAQNPEVLAVWAKAQDWAVQQIQDDPDKAAESVAVEVGVSTEEAKAQFAGLTYLRASEQVGPDYLGGKLGQDLFATAKFLLTQDGISEVADESVYVDGVDPTPAQAAAE